MRPKLVLVEWVDSAYLSGGWKSLEDIKAHTPAPCKSVGWMVSKTRAFLTLVPHFDGCESGLGDLIIPVRAVTKITPLVGD